MTAPVNASAPAPVSVGLTGAPRPTIPDPFNYPHHTFRFHVAFMMDPVEGESKGDVGPMCYGAFSECTGLEATMEPKVIKEGGRNYGAAQRAGPVTFATVVLKRGMTATSDLWKWFDLVTNQHKFARRLAATINVYDHAGSALMAWRLAHAMPVKFKGADLNAHGTEIGVEELHLVHEGLTSVPPSHPVLANVPQQPVDQTAQSR